MWRVPGSNGGIHEAISLKFWNLNGRLIILVWCEKRRTASTTTTTTKQLRLLRGTAVKPGHHYAWLWCCKICFVPGNGTTAQYTDVTLHYNELFHVPDHFHSAPSDWEGDWLIISVLCASQSVWFWSLLDTHCIYLARTKCCTEGLDYIPVRHNCITVI